MKQVPSSPVKESLIKQVVPVWNLVFAVELRCPLSSSAGSGRHLCPNGRVPPLGGRKQPAMPTAGPNTKPPSGHFICQPARSFGHRNKCPKSRDRAGWSSAAYLLFSLSSGTLTTLSTPADPLHPPHQPWLLPTSHRGLPPCWVSWEGWTGTSRLSRWRQMGLCRSAACLGCPPHTTRWAVTSSAGACTEELYCLICQTAQAWRPQRR